VGRWENRKEISGSDVMEILGIAFEVTNNPAYAAARKALIHHKLHTGGLKRALSNLYRRHHEPPEFSSLRRIRWYLRNGYTLREAVEHVAALEGIPGTSFSNAVEKFHPTKFRLSRPGILRAGYTRGPHAKQRQFTRPAVPGAPPLLRSPLRSFLSSGLVPWAASAARNSMS
jgi:hypothetical protein